MTHIQPNIDGGIYICLISHIRSLYACIHGLRCIRYANRTPIYMMLIHNTMNMKALYIDSRVNTSLRSYVSLFLMLLILSAHFTSTIIDVTTARMTQPVTVFTVGHSTTMSTTTMITVSMVHVTISASMAMLPLSMMP